MEKNRYQGGLVRLLKKLLRNIVGEISVDRMAFIRGLVDRLSVRGTEEMSLTNVDNEVGEILVSPHGR